jgi:hypothetical protein
MTADIYKHQKKYTKSLVEKGFVRVAVWVPAEAKDLIIELSAKERKKHLLKSKKGV